jgi:hypothetical protein
LIPSPVVQPDRRIRRATDRDIRKYAQPAGFGSWLKGRDAAGGNPYPAPSTYANCYLWLPGGDANYTSSGSPDYTVSSWADQSGNGHNANATQLDYPVQGHPTSLLPLVNGVDPLAFASGDTIQTTVTPAFSAFASCSVFAVVLPMDTGGFGGEEMYSRILEHSYSTSFYLGVNSAATGYQFIVNDSGIGTVEDTNLVYGTPCIVAGVYSLSTTTGTLYFNGSSTASGSFTAPSSGTTSAITVGRPSPFTGGAGQWSGGVLDIAVFTDAKSGSSLTNLFRYWGYEYGITVP